VIGFARAHGDENGEHDVGFSDSTCVAIKLGFARACGDENGVQDVGFLIARVWP
jgi:hypothetical protein